MNNEGIKLKNIIRHFKTVCIHKKWVFYYCCKAGIPWKGIRHDLSKFSPTEFLESVKYYIGSDSPINKCKSINGYSKSWQHHKGRNTHHYEYWTDNYDSGTSFIKMPFDDAVEMICDYLGAARAYMGDAFSFNKEYDWWKIKRINCAMNAHTKRFIDLVFKYISTSNNFNLFNRKWLLGLYNKLEDNYYMSDEWIYDNIMIDYEGILSAYDCHIDELKYPIRTTWFCFIWTLTHPLRNYTSIDERTSNLRSKLIKRYGKDFDRRY